MDIFGKLNALHLTLQCRKTNVLDMKEKIRGFMKKLSLWRCHIENGVTEVFPVLLDFLKEWTESDQNAMKGQILTHLYRLDSHSD